MLGSIFVGLANHLSIMIIGRILIGLGCGLATVTVPLFLAEIAPPSIKKSLGIMNQLFIVFGMLTGQSLSFPFSHGHRWRYVFLVAVVIGVVQLLGSFLVQDGEKVKEGEDEPLLGEAPAEPLSIKGLLSTNDTKIRRACELAQGPLLRAKGDTHEIQSWLFSSPRLLSRHAVYLQVRPFPLALASLDAVRRTDQAVMYFSTRILKPVFNGESRLIALFIVMAKIPLTILPAFLIEVSITTDVITGKWANQSASRVSSASPRSDRRHVGRCCSSSYRYQHLHRGHFRNGYRGLCHVILDGSWTGHLGRLV